MPCYGSFTDAVNFLDGDHLKAHVSGIHGKKYIPYLLSQYDNISGSINFDYKKIRRTLEETKVLKLTV